MKICEKSVGQAICLWPDEESLFSVVYLWLSNQIRAACTFSFILFTEKFPEPILKMPASFSQLSITQFQCPRFLWSSYFHTVCSPGLPCPALGAAFRRGMECCPDRLWLFTPVSPCSSVHLSINLFPFQVWSCLKGISVLEKSRKPTTWVPAYPIPKSMFPSNLLLGWLVEGWVFSPTNDIGCQLWSLCPSDWGVRCGPGFLSFGKPEHPDLELSDFP